MQISIAHSRPIEQTRQSIIKQKVDIPHIQKQGSSNPFAHLLKKTDNKWVKEERENVKQSQKVADSMLMQDKIDELKTLRQNIDSLTPKTVSSHGSDLVDMPDVDYNDPESYKKAQQLLETKQKEREAKKINKLQNN